MKSVIAGTMTVAVGLFAANMLGVAIAETTPSPQLRTVSVQGIGSAPVGQHDSAEAATAVYRQAMTNAVTDGQSKAGFLASKAGATLGTVQSIAEGGGYISCSGGEAEYAEYEGGQPDFGSGPQPVGIAAPAASAPPVRRVKARRLLPRQMAEQLARIQRQGPAIDRHTDHVGLALGEGLVEFRIGLAIFLHGHGLACHRHFGIEHCHEIAPRIGLGNLVIDANFPFP